jgi:membrane protease YdiL (CAAX protease family)
MAISSVPLQPIASSHVPNRSTHAPTSDGETTHCIIQPHNFFFLIPTITGIALGILFLPNFGLGLTIGAVDFMITVISFGILSKAGIIKHIDEKNSEYQKHLRKSLLAVSFFGPIAEEGVFRGLIQPLVTKSIQILVPAATAAVFGTGLSVATVVSIVATSVLFGAAHYFNPHKNSHIQAVSATVSGFVMGILSAQFGIGASIAAHIANNSIMSFFTAFLLPSEENKDSVRGQRKFDMKPLPT